MKYDRIAANQPFLSEIAEWCAARGISKTKFGVDALNDPAFVRGLEAGRQLTQQTMFRVRQFMDEAASA